MTTLLILSALLAKATGQNISGLIGPLLAEQGQTTNQARRLSAGTPGYTGSIAEPLDEAVDEAVEGVVEELADFFSFGRDQRDVLAPLEAAVNTAQDALDFIEEDLNATPEDRIAAYQALAAAEQALFDQASDVHYKCNRHHRRSERQGFRGCRARL